jgi:Xaa-Pro aminopeptidase
MRAAPPGVPLAEFRERQAAALAEAAERGLAALLVWSRMGTDMYRFGDVVYLTNHHGPVGDFQDAHGWNGHGYNPLILPVDGEPVLIVDLPPGEPDSVAVDDIRFATNVPRTVARALTDLGVDRERIGLVGTQTLLAKSRDLMEDELGHPLALEDADEVLERMRMVKSDAEVALMREAVAVGCECMDLMMSAVAAGVTEGDIVAEGIGHLVASNGFPTDVAITTGSRSHLYHNPVGPPNWDCERPLEAGEMVHIDLWGPVNRYYTDFARSTVVGGRPTDAQREILEAPLAAIPELLSAVRPGATIGEVFARGERWMKDNGWLDEGLSLADGPPEAGPLFEHVPIFGHGIGMSTEHPWIVADNPIVIEPNMVLAIEFIIARGDEGAYLEHDVLVTDAGYEILDAACRTRWFE